MPRNKILVLLALVCLLAVPLSACDDSAGSCAECDGDDTTDGDDPTDGDVPDGDVPDGDGPDGDDPDGDASCDACDFLAGNWCVQNPRGAACEQLSVAAVSVSEVAGSPCMFAAAVHFTNGTLPVFFYFQGCTIDALPILSGVCLLTIDSKTSTVSVDCPNLCTFTLAQEGCEPGCLCNEENACCDGCNPINEGDTCDDGNACTTGDACRSGACVPAALKDCSEHDDACNVGACVEGECEAQPRDDQTPCDDDDLCTAGDVCIEGVCTGTPLSCVAQNTCHSDGVCDPATGLCIHAAGPNGIACDGLGDGTPRSGVCRHGDCLALDACMMRVYNQPLGHTCNFDEDCESGLCSLQILGGFGKRQYMPNTCTRPCDPNGDDCPEGLACMSIFGRNKTENNGRLHLCLPVVVPPPYETRGILEPCTTDANCESGHCLYDDYGLSYCTQDCYGDRGPDDTLCGDCGVCRPWYDKSGGTKRPDYVCVAPPRQYEGGFCTSNHDCGDGFCYDNTCVTGCGGPKANSGNCPPGFACVDTREEYGNLCVPKRDVAFADEDEICTRQHACMDGLYCDMPPASGAMAGLFSRDLWDLLAGDAFFRAAGYTSHYSYFSYTSPATDSYYLMVNPWWSPISNYLLTVTTGAEPTQTIEYAGPINTPYIALPLELPSRVMASFRGWDSHWYRIDLEAGQTVTVALGPVADYGVCKPQKDYGDACHFDAECVGGACLFGHCTEACSIPRNDDPCPSGSSCTLISGIYPAKGDETTTKRPMSDEFCVPDDKLDLGAGETCHYRWQCASEFCLDGLCVEDCGDNGGPLRNGGGDCPTGYSCHELWGWKWLCLPDGKVDKDFGETCLDNFECASNYCFRGICNETCDDSEDCPQDHTCINTNYGNTVCFPVDQLDREFGEPCRLDAQCGSNLCIDMTCNIPCEGEPNRIPMPMCPEDFACLTHELGGSYDMACFPEDVLNKGFGETCRKSYECASQFCHFGRCNEDCGRSRVSGDCPSNYTCRPGYFSEAWACSPDSL